jgi:hypothetical protein
VVLMVAGFCITLAQSGTASAASSPITFSKPVLVDQRPPYSSTGDLAGVSCPNASLCVAVDSAGNVLTSTTTTGGASAWTVTSVDDNASLTGISCPSSSLCVAVDNYGDVVTSTNPTGGASAWTLTNVDASNGR